MRPLLAVAATLVVLLLLVLVFPYTGLFNVAATEGHTPLVEWYLETVSERSIAARADEVEVPADLSDSARVARGALAFSAMCQTCHGAPGHDRSVTGEGLSPRPPELSEEVTEWSPAELYWIIEHGIRMTGMPAYGLTHSEEELWEIVAFLQQLPEMTPARYTALTAPPEEGAADSTAAPPVHRHADGHDHVH